MQYTKIRLIGLSTIDLPVLGALPSDSYVFKGAEGLGPTAVDVSFSSSPRVGPVYLGRRPQNREIVLRVGISPDYRKGETVEMLRERFYGMMTLGVVDYVRVEIINGFEVVAYAEGEVASCDPTIFEGEPGIQLSILCFGPYLSAPQALDITGNLATEVSGVVNAGTAPSAFYAEVQLTAPTSSWGFYADYTDSNPKNRQMMFTAPLLAGDILKFNTQARSRKVELVRAGVTSNFIHTLTKDSEWIQLHGGLNSFMFTSDAFVWQKFVYTPKYLGV